MSSPAQEPQQGADRVAALLAEVEVLMVSQPPTALRLSEEAADLAQAQGNELARGQALCLKGGALFYQADHAAASEAFQAARVLGHRLGDATLEARALNGLGNVASYLGDYAGTIEYFLESARVAQEAGDELGHIRVLNNLAAVRAELGEYQEALQTHLEVMGAAHRLGSPLLEWSARANAVADYSLLDEHEQAIALADEHLPTLTATGLRQYEVVMRTYRARSLLELGRLEDAVAASRETLPLAEQIAEHDHLCRLLMTLGRAHHRQGEDALAALPLQRALALAEEYRLKLHERDAHQALGDVAEAQGDFPAALRHLRTYHGLERAIHAQDVDRRTRVLTAQFQFEALQRTAELERLRSEQLVRDNTALRQDQQLLAHRAAHDTLTGLANRAHFQAEAELALRERGEGLVGLLFIDLDGFKTVNDTLGHDVGDELLRQVGARLKRQVRREDLVARLGGDEFTVLLVNLRDAGNAAQVGQKLCAALTRPCNVGGQSLTVTASIGVAVAPRDGTDVATLQKHADAAMYRVKRSGRNGVQDFGEAR